MKEKIILVLALILNATMMTISKVNGDLNGIMFYGFFFVAINLIRLGKNPREKEIENKKEPFPKIDTDDFITTLKGQIVKAKQPLNLSDEIIKAIEHWCEANPYYCFNRGIPPYETNKTETDKQESK